MSIEIPRRAVLAMLLLLLVLSCAGLGLTRSPRNSVGRPVLLSPEVRAVEQYRRSVMKWVNDWQSLDGELQALLNIDGDLLSASQSAQRVFEVSTALTQSIEATEAPTSLIGLRDQCVLTAQQYRDASVAMARWISAPTPDNRIAAEQALFVADQLRSALENNQWIRDSH